MLKLILYIPHSINLFINIIFKKICLLKYDFNPAELFQKSLILKRILRISVKNSLNDLNCKAEYLIIFT